MKKYIAISLVLMMSLLLLITNCSIGEQPVVSVVESSVDLSGDVTIKSDVKVSSNWYVNFYSTAIHDHNFDDILQFDPTGRLHFRHDYEKIVNDYTISFKVPPKAVTSYLWVGGYDGIPKKTNNIMKVNYPELLNIIVTRASAGEKVTIKSDKPFFDVDTFSKEKVLELFSYDYRIVWIEVDENRQKEEAEFGNLEKYPINPEAYDMDALTPDSVTFILPDYARTGTVHVLTEHGLTNDCWEFDLESVIVIKENAAPYYCTKEILTVN